MEVEVLYAYDPKEPDELRLHVGDIIRKVVKQEAGWFKGTSRTGVTGVFPDNFVKVLGRDERSRESGNMNHKTGVTGAAPGRSDSIGRQCRVLFSYAPQHEDELTLCEGDVLRLLQEVEEGWWKGELNGQVGMFPSNFVEIISGLPAIERDEGSEVRNKNNINANLKDGEVLAPQPVTGQGFGPELKKELMKKLHATNGNGRRVSSAVLSGHTAGHTGHSAALMGHSAAPTGHSAAPTGHSAAPTGHSAAPTGHSAAPTSHSAAPTGHSAAPTGHSTAPMGHSATPMGHSTAPAGHSATPTSHSAAPTGHSAAPTGHTITTGHSAALSGHTPASTSPASARTDHTSIPTGNIVSPTFNSAAPLSHIQAPTCHMNTAPPPASNVAANRTNGVAGAAAARTSNGAPSKRSLGSSGASAFQPPGTKGKSSTGLYPVLSNASARSDATKAERDRINTAIEKEDTTKAVGRSSRQASLNRAAEPSQAPPPQLPPKPVREVARVLYPYMAEHEDELILREGDLITIVSKDLEDRGWWRGELDGRTGVFPDNFVQLLSSDEAPKPPRPDKPPSLGSHGSPATSSASASPTPSASKGAETVEPASGAALQDKRTTGTPAPALTNGHSMDAPRTEAEPLRHINQLRPRGPQRRPPSSIFKENMRLSAGSNGDSSAASADPVKLQLVLLEQARSTEEADRSSGGVPQSDKPQSQSSTDAIDVPSTAAAAHHGGDITSKILLRAVASKPFPAPTTAAVSTSAPPPRQVLTRPNTVMAGTNLNVPWLQELNAKQKRKSLLDSEREAAPLSPPVAAKPTALSTKPPHTPTPEVSPAKAAHESPDKSAHELPPAVKIVEQSPAKPAHDLHPAKPSIDSSLNKPLSDGTPSHLLQDEASVKPHSTSTHKIREHLHSESRSRRPTLEEPNAASSASSLLKSSSGSARLAPEGAAPHTQVSSGSEGDQVVALSNAAVSSSTSQSSLLSSEYSLLSSQSPQPSLAPALAPSTAGQASNTSPPNSPLHDFHPPPGAAHDSSRLPKISDDVAGVLETLLPKVLLLEEQHRSHARQLLALTEELDEERKKRACLEIEMERLRKVLMTHTAAV